MKATSGGSTTCTKKNIHWAAQPIFGFMALLDHTSTAEVNGSIAVNSANANPTEISNRASTGNSTAAPTPMSSNKYGASVSHPPSTPPAANAMTPYKQIRHFKDVLIFLNIHMPLFAIEVSCLEHRQAASAVHSHVYLKWGSSQFLQVQRIENTIHYMLFHVIYITLVFKLVLDKGTKKETRHHLLVSSPKPSTSGAVGAAYRLAQVEYSVPPDAHMRVRRQMLPVSWTKLTFAGPEHDGHDIHSHFVHEPHFKNLAADVASSNCHRTIPSKFFRLRDRVSDSFGKMIGRFRVPTWWLSAVGHHDH